MSAIVSDLVVQTHAAAAEAIAQHYHTVFGSFSPPEAVARALDFGYDADLEERTSPHQPVGFDHHGINRVFRRRLRRILYSKQASQHIYEADEEQGNFSLFGRTTTENWREPRRTRASAIVQRLIRDCRTYRQAEKASLAREGSRMVVIPSPLLVARQLLGDPRSVGSQVYAAAAFQEWIREQIEAADHKPIDLSFAAITDALTLINNRWKTSKPIVADRIQNGSTVVYLCNLLALQGLAAMRVDVQDILQALAFRVDKGDEKDDLEAKYPDLPQTQTMDRHLLALWLGGRDVSCEFVINPQYAELPSAGAILNLVEGLPVPFEGGDTIFQGGIRLSANSSLVAAISGEFGAGKTLFSLSLAAALAPLGCRTLFLSCEESARDIRSRLLEAAPRSLFRSLPLFKALDENTFKLRQFEQQMALEDVDGTELTWFTARQLQVREAANRESIDPARGLAALLEEALTQAEIFRPWWQGAAPILPRFARPVVIIDGLHQLFDLPETYEVWDSSLRNLVDACRNLGAIFLFSFSSEAEELQRLEYLCDLILEVERGGHNDPSEKPDRVFQLLKARRQPARTGAHLFHIKGDAGFRLKPSIDARVQELKNQLWWQPTERSEIFLADDPPPGFKESTQGATPASTLSVANHAQVLVIGQGSSGKASFGLYLLHRRWFDTAMLRDDRQLALPMQQGQSAGDLPVRKAAILSAGLPVRTDSPFLETRVLVISFLYQRSYYDELTSRLSSKRRGKADRESTSYVQLDELGPVEYAPLPDKLRTDTIELYPGMLSVEDFIAKVEKRLGQAERSGSPYTGVLVDGLHNVFVQFPLLERESSFWGMFYNILRRRRVTVVTTHTEFDINAHPDVQDGEPRREGQMAYDFEQAQRKIAPLLSALVSGADYLFDLSPSYEAKSLVCRLTPRAAIGGNVTGQSYAWEKRSMRLEPLPVLRATSRTGNSERRRQLAHLLGDQLLELMSLDRRPGR